MENVNPVFVNFAAVVKAAAKCLERADYIAANNLHWGENYFEPIASVLSEVAECARRELILKAYRVSRRIKVSEKRPKKPTSAAKLAAAKEAGKKGGLAKSAAKTTSNRANAKKPRPSRRGKPVGKRWS
jgi:hypothetical protein